MNWVYFLLLFLLVLPFILERSYNFHIRDFDDFLKDEKNKKDK